MIRPFYFASAEEAQDRVAFGPHSAQPRPRAAVDQGWNPVRVTTHLGCSTGILRNTTMHLVQILLPLHDTQGRGFPKAKYETVAAELTNLFGGVTAYTRTPAEGRWKPGGQPASEDDIVVFEAMVETLDPKWWRRYRKTLERGFKQKSIIVRAQDIQLL